MKRKKKVMVKCNGVPSYHKCEERRCRHRKRHVMRGSCGKRLHNDADRWCIGPGTKSMLEAGAEDGGLVTCISVTK